MQRPCGIYPERCAAGPLFQHVVVALNHDDEICNKIADAGQIQHDQFLNDKN